ncbi:unnamed protein product [Durusdinium trenchii]|uniref:Uncharacterized protein n=2 Tax=Durusdinium trenchii TaxID=1381693 RepID=A0ABP0KC75_9DINO
MKSSLSELGRPGGRASLKEKCCCRCYSFLVCGVFVFGVLLIVMGAMKDLTLSGASDDWSFTWGFDSTGKGMLALVIGCSVTVCAFFFCCIPICCAECASSEMRHAWGQESRKCRRWCAYKCCCCCTTCFNCCNFCCEHYCCCCSQRRRDSETTNTDYVPRTDPYAVPEVPEMVEVGRPVEMKATAI